MVNMDVFLNTFFGMLKNEFGSRIWFAGLQGSYARGEADENSDIDIVVILDELILKTYLSIKKGAEINIQKMSENLFNWSKKIINQ